LCKALGDASGPARQDHYDQAIAQVHARLEEKIVYKLFLISSRGKNIAYSHSLSMESQNFERIAPDSMEAPIFEKRKAMRIVRLHPRYLRGLLLNRWRDRTETTGLPCLACSPGFFPGSCRFEGSDRHNRSLSHGAAVTIYL
jgi:hypothetical protein